MVADVPETSAYEHVTLTPAKYQDQLVHTVTQGLPSNVSEPCLGFTTTSTSDRKHNIMCLETSVSAVCLYGLKVELVVHR